MALVDARDPNAVREAARRILERPEFEQERDTWWQTLLHYAAHPLDALSLLLTWIFDQFSGSGAAPFIAWTVAVVALVAAIALVVWLTRSTSRDNVVPIREAPRTYGKSTDELLREAEAFEADGRWRDALRAQYSALIVRLADDGVLQGRPGRTTGEYAAEVARNVPEAQRPFTDATRLFEWVWYGDAQPSKQDVERFRSLSNDVRGCVAT